MNGWYESLPKGPTRPGSSDHVVEIRCSPNLNWKSLTVMCREVMLESSERAGYSPTYLVPSRIPPDETLRAWSEQDILLNHRTTFGGRIEQCLASYKTAFRKTRRETCSSLAVYRSANSCCLSSFTSTCEPGQPYRALSEKF